MGQGLVIRDISQTADHDGAWLSTEDLDCVPMASAWKVDEIYTWLLGCSAFSMDNVPYRYTDGNAGSEGYFGVATWHARAFAAYKMIAGALTQNEKVPLLQWFYKSAWFHQNHIDDDYYGIGLYFPGRKQGDYTPAPGGAADTCLLEPYRGHSQSPPMSVLSGTFNNRRASCIFFSSMVGAYFRDLGLITGVKRYIKEWVTYSVYGDGTQGDWVRNEGSAVAYGYNSSGMTYGAYDNALALISARWLREIGDNELLEFRTAAGLCGTQSLTPKSIYTTLDAHMSCLQGSRIWFDIEGEAFNQAGSPYGYLNHITWVWPAVRDDIRYAEIGRLIRKTPKLINDPFGAWRGMAGAWLDVRLPDCEAPGIRDLTIPPNLEPLPPH